MPCRLSSSLVFLQFLLLGLCALTLLALWGLFFSNQYSQREEALSATASEHLNLASMSAENLSQLVDRAQALGRVLLLDIEEGGSKNQSLIRLLARDPVLKRMSLYDQQGQLIYASHPDETSRLPRLWQQQLTQHIEQYGFRPLLPYRLSEAQPGQLPSWRLPFLLPLVDPSNQQLEATLLVQLDIGYLADLLQDIDLGGSGTLRLIDGQLDERLRVDSTGVVQAGEVLRPLLPSQLTGAGEFNQFSATEAYQSLYRHVPGHGFTLIVSQARNEILTYANRMEERQLWLNVGMTILILLAVFWSWRVLGKREEAFGALEQAQRVNQQLIVRLEDEHRRSSLAAATDHLSGLHNRRQFLLVAEQILLEQRTRRRLLAVLFIDMDRFKSINDSLGHKVGDLLLQAVAGRISRALQPGDEAARFGGDEFVVLLAGDRSQAQIDEWVKALVAKLSSPYVLERHELNTSPSIGVSLSPRDGVSVDELVRAADSAMYVAKQSGRGQYRYFDPALNRNDVAEFALEQAFAGALAEHQFVLHFQPLMGLENMEISSYEALVRWQHPEFGLLYPDRFIDLAERSGFIVALGWEVLRLACEELCRWQTRGVMSPLAVNVSPLQLRQHDFSQRLLEMLTDYGVAPSRLELEITETTVLDNQGLAIAHLQALRDAGLAISLDDFGQGYAGFSHLQALPLTKLKIDRSLISQISNSPDDSPIVTSTIILAKRLGLKVVGEGVESREQLVYLRLAGCDIAQGYHISRPLSVGQLYASESFQQTVEPICGA